MCEYVSEWMVAKQLQMLLDQNDFFDFAVFVFTWGIDVIKYNNEQGIGIESSVSFNEFIRMFAQINVIGRSTDLCSLVFLDYVSCCCSIYCPSSRSYSNIHSVRFYLSWGCFMS